MKAAWVEKYKQEKNIELIFFKKLTVKEKATVYFAAPAACKAYVNGKFIYAGTKRVAEGFTAVNTFSLNKGENSLCFEVVHYGIGSFEYFQQPPFFAVEVVVDGKAIADVFDFTCARNHARKQRVERYSCQRNFLECYEYIENPLLVHQGELPYEKEVLTEVTMPTLIASKGYAPSLREIPIDNIIDGGRVYHKEHFYDEIIPPYAQVTNPKQGYVGEELEVKVSTEASSLGFESAPYQPPNLCDEFLTYALQQEKTGYFQGRVTAKAGTELFLLFDEIIPNKEELLRLPGGETFAESNTPIAFHRLTAVNALKIKFLKDGEYEFSSLEPYSLQYLKVAVLGEIRGITLSLLLCENSAVQAELHTEKCLQEIWNAAVNTFSQNVVDIYMDCPSRERAGWLCDSFFMARAECLLTGKNCVEEAFLHNYCIAPPLKELPKEMFPMCYPSTFSNGNYIPNWAMFLVVELYDGRERLGKDFILRFEEKVRTLLHFFEKYENENGLLESLDKWIFVEWSDSNKYVRDVNYPTNMLYAAALSSAAALYGEPCYAEKAKRIRAEIRRQSFNGEFFVDHAKRIDGKLVVQPQITETCQYYAMFFGLCEGEEFLAFRKKMMEEFGGRNRTDYSNVSPSNMFIGNFLRLDLLKKYGYRERLLLEIKEKFSYMASRTGTLWENINTAASCNHGFASYATVLITYALGGYHGVDERKKQIFFVKDYAKEDFKLTLPLAQGALTIELQNGKRKITAEGYEVVMEEA